MVRGFVFISGDDRSGLRALVRIWTLVDFSLNSVYNEWSRQVMVFKRAVCSVNVIDVSTKPEKMAPSLPAVFIDCIPSSGQK